MDITIASADASYTKMTKEIKASDFSKEDVYNRMSQDEMKAYSNRKKEFRAMLKEKAKQFNESILGEVLYCDTYETCSSAWWNMGEVVSADRYNLAVQAKNNGDQFQNHMFTLAQESKKLSLEEMNYILNKATQGAACFTQHTDSEDCNSPYVHLNILYLKDEQFDPSTVTKENLLQALRDVKQHRLETNGAAEEIDGMIRAVQLFNKRPQAGHAAQQDWQEKLGDNERAI